MDLDHGILTGGWYSDFPLSQFKKITASTQTLTDKAKKGWCLTYLEYVLVSKDWK